MSILPNDGRMKPIIILPPETVSAEDIKALRENGLCVVEAKNPSAVAFLDPIPSMAERTKIEDTAIQLSRKLLNPEAYYSRSTNSYVSLARSDATRMFVDLLLSGTALDAKPTPTEVQKQVFDEAKTEELRKIAREEAREEAAKRREAKKGK